VFPPSIKVRAAIFLRRFFFFRTDKLGHRAYFPCGESIPPGRGAGLVSSAALFYRQAAAQAGPCLIAREREAELLAERSPSSGLRGGRPSPGRGGKEEN